MELYTALVLVTGDHPEGGGEGDHLLLLGLQQTVEAVHTLQQRHHRPRLTLTVGRGGLGTRPGLRRGGGVGRGLAVGGRGEGRWTKGAGLGAWLLPLLGGRTPALTDIRTF